MMLLSWLVDPRQPVDSVRHWCEAPWVWADLCGLDRGPVVERVGTVMRDAFDALVWAPLASLLLLILEVFERWARSYVQTRLALW